MCFSCTRPHSPFSIRFRRNLCRGAKNLISVSRFALALTSKLKTSPNCCECKSKIATFEFCIHVSRCSDRIAPPLMFTLIHRVFVPSPEKVDSLHQPPKSFRLHDKQHLPFHNHNILLHPQRLFVFSSGRHAAHLRSHLRSHFRVGNICHRVEFVFDCNGFLDVRFSRSLGSGSRIARARLLINHVLIAF